MDDGSHVHAEGRTLILINRHEYSGNATTADMFKSGCRCTTGIANKNMEMKRKPAVPLPEVQGERGGGR